MSWRPLHLDFILAEYNPLDKRVLLTLFGWIILISANIWFSLYSLPEDWVRPDGDKNQLLSLFLFNPTMIIGLLLLFWFGFEWSFIVVFLSMFIVGVFSSLNPFWAILFGLSFSFGLSIYAIVFHCISIRYDLGSLRSVFVYIVTSFVAATASSLGTFIWSLEHNLTASETAKLWNGWWAGSFLQSILLVGLILYALSPFVERWKEKHFKLPERREVSTRWIYSAVVLVTGIISVFIYSGDYLGKKRVSEQIENMNRITSEAILSSLESFGTITWVSIWIVFCVGIGAVFLIGSWNSELKKKVLEKTESLKNTKEELKESLAEKETLLTEIHHRVKNNLAVVNALLELQLLKNEDPGIKLVLSDSISRVKSMAIVHETLYQTETFSSVDIAEYLEKLCDSIGTTLKSSDKEIQILLSVDPINLSLEKAISLGLLVNEVIINSYKHAFKNLSSGNVFIRLKRTTQGLNLEITDDGTGFSESANSNGNKKSIGLKLINILSKQLKGTLELKSENGKTSFKLQFQKERSMNM